jgi:hypothetical protein
MRAHHFATVVISQLLSLEMKDGHQTTHGQSIRYTAQRRRRNGFIFALFV